MTLSRLYNRSTEFCRISQIALWNSAKFSKCRGEATIFHYVLLVRLHQIRNLAIFLKSGCGQISSQIWQMLLQLQYVQLTMDKTNALQLTCQVVSSQF